MCGRYTFFTDREIGDIEEIIDQIDKDVNRDKLKTGEIFPSETAPVLCAERETVRPRLFAWGFPGFQGSRLIINARAETALEKRMFQPSILARRCVIPSTGFYEWDKAKRKYQCNLPDSDMLYMAGFYNCFEGEDRFVILTTAANPSMIDIHERMPLIIRKQEVENWIYDVQAAKTFLSREQPDLVNRLV